jgi:phosphoribosyl-ATP pyrophosphohydrolase/phosphoribosyl-AMP cyclohydrolase
VTGALDVDAVRFDDVGLVPVVAQDALTGDVLMVAWSDRQALEKTMETGFMHYHSRSRGRLWKKGEESGHTQELVEIRPDCDNDTLLARVRQRGPACHTEAPTCFTGDRTPGGLLTELAQLIAQREDADPETSYTARLLKDKSLRTKKVGEEATEFVMALTNEERDRVAEEAADLLYHMLVAAWGRKVSLVDILKVLEGRKQ